MTTLTDLTDLTPSDGYEENELSEMLDEVQRFQDRFIAYPSQAASDAHTLWNLSTHLIDKLDIHPRLAFMSPDPGSGKTRALDITSLLVQNPIHLTNVSTAYLFRKIEDSAELGTPTVLMDEVDTVFRGVATDKSEELRALLNGGYKRGPKVGRAEKKNNTITTADFDAFCAVALAGLRELPPTMADRSIVIQMKKRSPDRKLEPYRMRLHEPEGLEKREWLKSVADTIRHQVGTYWPELPDGVEDREADKWECLILIADLVGGSWPQRARDAALHFVGKAKENHKSLGIELLSDIHKVLGMSDKVFTADLVNRLVELEESQWNTVSRGKPLTAQRLASILKPYDIEPIQIVINGTQARGYERTQFVDQWRRNNITPAQVRQVRQVRQDVEEIADKCPRHDWPLTPSGCPDCVAESQGIAHAS